MAQYSDDLEVVKEFIRKYDIDFWLLDGASFVPDSVHDNNWVRQHKPFAQEAIANLRSLKVPVLVELSVSLYCFC